MHTIRKYNEMLKVKAAECVFCN